MLEALSARTAYVRVPGGGAVSTHMALRRGIGLSGISGGVPATNT